MTALFAGTMMTITDQQEWLEADGRGGFASGTATGVRTRRYHALLLTATTPPTGRMVLVSGLDVWVEGEWGCAALSSQRYAPDVVAPDGLSHLEAFTHEPWPTWTYRIAQGIRLRHDLFVDRQSGATVMRWQVEGPTAPLTLRVRPFMAGRDYHGMQHENASCRFSAESRGAAYIFRPYDGVPAIAIAGNAEYRQSPDWYRQFLYSAEVERGLDAVEDLATPGEFVFTLQEGSTAALLLGTSSDAFDALLTHGALDAAEQCRARESQRRGQMRDPLERAADAYLAQRGTGRTILAGYPWFTDWGRDAFIALRGLCLETGRFDDARRILIEWAGAVSEGMLPNRFPDGGDAPEFNSVDASLWYVVAVEAFMTAAKGTRRLSLDDRQCLTEAVLAIVAGYAGGTRFGIRMDSDGLLAAGVRGQQLTWMDARVGDREITPRIGKPVEIQALWLNALVAASRHDVRWNDPLTRGRQAFVDRFWDAGRGYLADVVDVDHVPGAIDVSFRPNQIFAIGGLPLALITGAPARTIVDAVESRLLTPLGLRSLTPDDPHYVGRYQGGPVDRDGVYHQGTVWPWLIGPFVEAWLRVRRNSAAAKREARERFVQPLLEHLTTAGLGHVSEIADGDAPFTPRGCPFQAWSVAELLRARALTETNRPVRSTSRETVSLDRSPLPAAGARNAGCI